MGLRDTLASMKQGEADAKATAEATVADWSSAHTALLNRIRFEWLSEYANDGALEIRDSVEPTHEHGLGPYNAMKLNIIAGPETITIHPKKIGVLTVHHQKYDWDGRIEYDPKRSDPWSIAMPAEDEHEAMMRGVRPTWHFKPLTKESFEAVLEEVLKGHPQHRGTAR